MLTTRPLLYEQYKYMNNTNDNTKEQNKTPDLRRPEVLVNLVVHKEY